MRTVFMLLMMGQVAGVVNTIQLLRNTVYAINQTFTAADSFCRCTLLECINYTP